MEKFNRTAHGYDPDEVNAFLDQVINHVEKIAGELKVRDAKIRKLEEELQKQGNLKEKVEQYQRMEETLNKALYMAQKTSDQIKNNAYRESELLVEDAKRNANRIVNEALLKAERTEDEAATLKRNINVYKRRLKAVIEQQLEMINDIEKVDF
ncbi:MAG: DivIVA domain-containing protein [Bacilli bacterium]